jgi:hypothetical protein
LTDASITALALEESLHREWNAFHSRVDSLAAPPGTRADADRMVRYAGHTGFVESILDALSLHLAGKNSFDRKLLCYLDLVLIQRSEPEDVTMLLKLAAHHSERNDLNALLSLHHRLRLYEDRPALGGALKYCSDRLRRFDVATDNATWAASVGIQPHSDNWHVNLRLGTAPPEYWFTRKSALKPQDASLELLVTAPGQWRIQVARVDRLYSAQWRPAGITVDTDQPQLKALSTWPAVAGHPLFPLFAARLADFLHLKWQRSARLTTNDVTVDRVRLLDWLHCCADELQS